MASKILVVSRSTVAHRGSGGMERVFEDLVCQLSAQYDFGLVTTPGADMGSLEAPYRAVWEVEGAKPGRYSMRWWLNVSSGHSPWFEWTPDVILSVSSAALPFAVDRRWRNVSKISQCHGTAVAEVASSLNSLGVRELAKVPLNISRVPREVLAYRRFDSTIAVGPGIADQLQGWPYQLDQSKLVTIANGIDESLYSFSAMDRAEIRRSLGLDQCQHVAMVASRLHRQKGVDVVLRGLANLGDERSHLIICGDGPERSTLVALANDLGVRDQVHFAGALSSRDVSAHMSAADVLLFPTRRREGLPLVVLEALANGLQVITVEEANVPKSLKRRVVTIRHSVKDLVGAWREVGSRSVESRLPADFTLASSAQAYAGLIENYM